MSLKRYATKRDRTEPEILRALHQVGAQTVQLDAFDVLCWFRGRLHMLDCKAPKGRITKSQQALVEAGWPLHFVTTPEEALAAIGIQTEAR